LSTIVATIEMDPHMVVILVYVGKNLVGDVLLDGGLAINIITNSLKKRLGLQIPSPVPFNLKMVNQSLTKPVGLIRDVKFQVHGIPYIATFTVMGQNDGDGSYIMMLRRP